MGSYSKTYRATAAPSIGANWNDVEKIYDGNANSYAYRTATSTSATHINGFGINLPSYAVVNSLEVHSKLYSGNSDGYIVVFVFSDLKTSSSQRIAYTTVVDGASLSAQYVTHTYTAEQLLSGLATQGIHNGNLVEFLANLRVRFVIGDAGNSSLLNGVCRVYDNYVVVNYTIPDITYTYKNYDGTVLKTQTVEQGTSPTPPSNPTRPPTAEYSYTFSGWSLSGTTYTAQYTATKLKYIISVSAENGSISGGGTYEYGTSATLTAIPNNGYKFSHWLIDGVTSGSSNPVSISVTKNTTVIAVFQKMAYVTYDSILNFQKWKDNGISGSNAVVSNITNIGFTLTSNDGVSEGTASSPFFKVEAGESYKIDIDIDGDGWDVYIFFHSDTSTGLGLEFTDGGNRFSSNGGGVSSRIFTAPAGSTRAQIRVDANGANNTLTYSNFRIYPAKYEYMGDSITAEHAEQRSNCGQWNMPIPERAGYNFIGWNNKLDGGGIFYTENSEFPTEDTILYSQWEVITLPEINSVQITPNPCNAGQGFIISVGFTE